MAQEFGFRLIYAIQTLLLKKQEASRLDYENIKDILMREEWKAAICYLHDIKVGHQAKKKDFTSCGNNDN
jgi:hypothetical protein